MNKSDEQVLVIPTAVLREAGMFQGLCRDIIPYMRRLLDPNQTRFMPRALAEEDPSFKQLIPYVVLKHGEDLFHYTRGTGMGEKRLHGLRSIGIGGHINPVDSDETGSLFEGKSFPFREGMLREVAEEVAIETRHREELFGFINDDSTPVGRVHLGIVHIWHLDEPKVQRREVDLLGSGFAPIAELANAKSECETWSQLVLDELIRSA